ncbi:MAG: hypothetical protein IKT53_01930 [Bacteroidaceae bacterium]|nr:hypothetical protein [Bacteroidaceae bacterium]
MDTEKNKCRIRKCRLSMSLKCLMSVSLAMSMLLSVIGCGASDSENGGFSSAESEAALEDLNRQNIEKTQLIRATINELAELTGPIADMQETKKMSHAEELNKRISMLKKKIHTLEAIAADSTDRVMARNLRALLEDKENQIRKLKEEVKRKDAKIDEMNNELANRNAELEKNYLRLQQQHNKIVEQQKKMARILYVVAEDYMEFGRINFHDLRKKDGRALQKKFYDSAVIRFRDAQNCGYGDCTREINDAIMSKNAIK